MRKPLFIPFEASANDTFIKFSESYDKIVKVFLLFMALFAVIDGDFRKYFAGLSGKETFSNAYYLQAPH